MPFNTWLIPSECALSCSSDNTPIWVRNAEKTLRKKIRPHSDKIYMISQFVLNARTLAAAAASAVWTDKYYGFRMAANVSVKTFEWICDWMKWGKSFFFTFLSSFKDFQLAMCAMFDSVGRDFTSNIYVGAHVRDQYNLCFWLHVCERQTGEEENQKSNL